MNRQQRRNAQKKGVTANDLKIAQRASIEFTTSAILASVAVVAHDNLGFGRKRTMRLLNQIEDQFDSVLKGYVTIDELKGIIRDELGIDMT